jgi:CheY-like chemotaxis protein
LARILVIDDDAGVRVTIARILERAGHTAVQAANGAEGLRQFGESAFDIVITDLYMPEMEGLETIQAIRSANTSIPILAISGGIMGDKIGPLGDAAFFGATATLEKPFENERLVAVVAGLLD